MSQDIESYSHNTALKTTEDSSNVPISHETSYQSEFVPPLEKKVRILQVLGYQDVFLIERPHVEDDIEEIHFILTWEGESRHRRDANEGVLCQLQVRLKPNGTSEVLFSDEEIGSFSNMDDIGDTSRLINPDDTHASERSPEETINMAFVMAKPSVLRSTAIQILESPNTIPHYS